MVRYVSETQPSKTPPVNGACLANKLAESRNHAGVDSDSLTHRRGVGLGANVVDKHVFAFDIGGCDRHQQIAASFGFHVVDVINQTCP